MEYTFKLSVVDLKDLDNPLIASVLKKDDEILSQKAWLNKPFDPNRFTELWYEVMEEMFPKKLAPDNTEEEVEKPSSPTKTSRGKTK